MSRTRWIAVAAALLAGAGVASAARWDGIEGHSNPPVPRYRIHYVPPTIPRYRLHYVRPMIPRVRTHLLRKPVVPEVRTYWLKPPVQPKPIYQPLAPPGSRTERLFKVVRMPHYREGLEAAKEPERDRADVERHRLTRWANGGQAPRLRLKRGDQGRLREAVKKQVYKEMNITRFSPPGEIKRAEALIPGRFRRALRNGEALALLYPDQAQARAR